MKKYIGISLLLIFSALPVSIHAQGSSTAPSDSSIQNIKNMVVEKTPEFIAKPVAYIANTIEEFRFNTGASFEKTKLEVEGELKVIEGDETSIKAISGAGEVVKPVKYAKLYTFTALSFIFNTKLVFYGIFFLILFYITRYIYRLIF